jgi:hypothetical protein
LKGALGIFVSVKNVVQMDLLTLSGAHCLPVSLSVCVCVLEKERE